MRGALTGAPARGGGCAEGDAAEDVAGEVDRGDASGSALEVGVGRRGRPGELDGDEVATGDGGLRLVQVQPEGKAPTDARSWANGARPADGERFGGEG